MVGNANNGKQLIILMSWKRSKPMWCTNVFYCVPCHRRSHYSLSETIEVEDLVLWSVQPTLPPMQSFYPMRPVESYRSIMFHRTNCHRYQIQRRPVIISKMHFELEKKTFHENKYVCETNKQTKNKLRKSNLTQS